MSFWDYLNKKAKQERASRKADQWCKDVMDYAHNVGELQRRFKRPVGVVE